MWGFPLGQKQETPALERHPQSVLSLYHCGQVFPHVGRHTYATL